MSRSSFSQRSIFAIVLITIVSQLSAISLLKASQSESHEDLRLPDFLTQDAIRERERRENGFKQKSSGSNTFSLKSSHKSKKEGKLPGVPFIGHKHHRSHHSIEKNEISHADKNRINKILQLNISLTKIQANLKTTQDSLAAAQKENADLKAGAFGLNKQIVDLQDKVKFVAFLEQKVQNLTKIVNDLKSKCSGGHQDAGDWKKKYDELASKLCDYEESIKKLNAYIADLKDINNKDDSARQQLEQAVAKIAELQKDLDEANEKLRGRSHAHKWKKFSRKEESKKEKSIQHSKNDAREFQIMTVTPRVISSKNSWKDKRSVLVGDSA
jgi:chromosome segregation ATPase